MGVEPMVAEEKAACALSRVVSGEASGGVGIRPGVIVLALVFPVREGFRGRRDGDE